MAASEYTRTSRRAEAGSMPPEFRAALTAHGELVGAAVGPPRFAAVTDSEPRSRGFLRRRSAYTTWIVLGAAHLAIVSDATGRPVASLYRLAELEAKPFESPLVEDEGLDVLALPAGASERSSVFVPLAGPLRDELLAELRA